MRIPSLKVSMHEFGGGGRGKKARGLRGKEAANAGGGGGGDADVVVVVDEGVYSSIMDSPARAKHPAPMDTWEDLHRAMRRADACVERVTAMWPDAMGGRVEGE